MQRRVLVAFVVGCAGFGAGLSGAGATTITQPVTKPIVTQRDVKGLLAAVTIQATGFAPGTSVFVEQCDGKAPTTPQWSPSLDCDNGTSPSAAIADRSGTATFKADDPNRAFRPFSGESPSTSFNCVAPKEALPKNGLPTFTTCQIRVSSNDSSATSDQVFAPLVLAAAGRGTAPAAPTKVAPAKATTTTVAGHATKKPAAKAKKGAAAAAKNTTTSTTVCTGDACAAAGARAAGAKSSGSSGAGLFALGDAGVATGYGLLAAGIILAVVAILIARRRATPTAR